LIFIEKLEDAMHYKNFKTAVYLPTWVSVSLTKEKLNNDYEFIEKYIGLDKVYLETHREQDVSKDQLLMIKNFLEEKGVEVSGGITTVIRDFEGAEMGKRRLFDTFCYTDPAMRKRLKEIVEFTAGIFDEIILDDFYFTNCSCERCIKEKGDRDWVTFRRELMKEVSENLVVKPAKAVNPKVNMIIKYPNWRESYHSTGYLPDDEKEIFDETYIGTETRSPKYADQHLPEYLSYSLARYIENAWPKRNNGGWFDTYRCYSADRYLEQCYLTAFSKVKELTFFQWGDLIDHYFVGSVGIQLKKIDEMLNDTGKPVGVPVYIPYASRGEDHLEMRLGMLGIPIDPSPAFPSETDVALFTESSAKDKDAVVRIKDFVALGNDAVITTGFLKAAGDLLRKEGLTEAEVTDRKISVTRYQITDEEAGYIDDAKPILFPEVVHANNDSWSLLNGGDGDYHTPLVLMSTYGKGRVFIISVPDNQADIYNIPEKAVDVIKRILSLEGFASGKDFSMFAYDDQSFILYRYVKGDLRPSHVRIYTRKDAKKLVDIITGREYSVTDHEIWEDYKKCKYKVADVVLTPGVFSKFRWEI